MIETSETLKRNKKRKLLFVVSIFLIVPVLCFLYAYYEARNIVVNQINFSDTDIPKSFMGTKIIFISDIHCNQYFTPRDVSKLVKRINELKPDIILLGGDNSLIRTEYSTPFFEEMSKLNSKHGIYSVLGNHDHWGDAKCMQQGLRDCGFHICDNQSYWIRQGKDSIKIGGVGDFWEDEQLLDKTVNDVKKEDFCILLSHNPDYMEILESDRVDLMLSGHTHAGQVTFFGLWAPIMPSTMHSEYMQTGMKYRYGWVKKDSINLYITSGIGMGSFPFRFFASPEIVEIALTH